jgi:hypothetical protein
MTIRDAQNKGISVAEVAKKSDEFSPDSDTDDSDYDKRPSNITQSQPYADSEGEEEPPFKKIKSVPTKTIDLSKLRPLTNNTFSPKELWPLVRFTNGRQLLCCALQFTVQGFRGNVEALRFQVPLILCWALSIHKSQGQTLERVYVDLNNIFENGQCACLPLDELHCY